MILNNMDTKNKINSEVKKDSIVTKTEIKKDLDVKKYTVRFGMNYEKESEDKIFITLTISEDLKKLLNEVVVKTLTVVPYNLYEVTNNRYKCKTWLFDSLYQNERDLLLDKGLVDTGEMEISFINITAAETFINNMKKCLQQFISVVMKYKDFGEEVTYTVTR